MTPRARELSYPLNDAFYRLAWVEFGDPAATPVVCVHGLTLSGRDFDPLAEGLADQFRVILVDLPGRGRSEWLPDAALYTVPNYVVALTHVLAAVGTPVRFVGTSLGGICGMALAAMANTPIARLVLNDIGPFIPKAALARIGDYLQDVPTFPDIAALEAHLREIHAPFGELTVDQWSRIAHHSARTLPDGRVTLHYDPAIAAAYVATEPADIDLWPYWERIKTPTLVIRGGNSDILEIPTLARMEKSGAQSFVIPGVGHAPALADPQSISVVRRFFLRR
jgi:pimeloyl-ACP methyl ester carboxylesterase